MHAGGGTMNAKAYVLIEEEAGEPEAVVVALRDLATIRAADVVTGPYDVIATVETSDQPAIGRLVMDQLQHIPGIKRTITCLVIA